MERLSSDHSLQQGDHENHNVTWLNFRGSWITQSIVVIVIRLTLAILPGLSPEVSWTLTNLVYNTATFIMFHWVIGTPFDHNQNECGNLTLWEQMDNGAQFTPTKKFLATVPILLFLVSTHYANYDMAQFTVNIVSLLIVLIAKLPSMHKVRLFGINKPYPD
ncbi:ORMDL family [Blyttiomyces helicus]|uniref:ORMDL family n=1 Tax=Blyttiomyces helicus TaxID=388810 RepID=A0A4P9WF44_9FUNG|nr:ORMDL family [Blyttiomyces helicus]|eukprot:RKO89046.1 ORMDL family [Blyttiomyces helicus]